MLIKKIQENELNLDVEGQGCWDDCVEWVEAKTRFNHPYPCYECTETVKRTTSYTWPFW